MGTTTAKRAYRFRFYPTPEQEQTLRRTLGCCRKVYNMALDARSEAWTVRHESVSYEDTSRMRIATADGSGVDGVSVTRW